MSFQILVGAIIVMICYWRWRNLYYTRLAIRHRFAMFRLRDELRRAVIDGRVKQHSEAFQIMDFMLCYSIGKAERYNIFTVVATHVSAGKPMTGDPLAMHLKATLAKEQVVMETLQKFRIQMQDYFIAKHYFIQAIAKATYGWQVARNFLNQKAEKMAQSFIDSANNDAERYLAGVH